MATTIEKYLTLYMLAIILTVALTHNTGCDQPADEEIQPDNQTIGTKI
jgi:hypothetical protein